MLGFLNVWFWLSDKFDIFVCLWKFLNSICVLDEFIFSFLNFFNKWGKLFFFKVWDKFWVDVWCGFVERFRKVWEGGKFCFVFIMVGYDLEKFDGMFFVMC